MLHPDYPVRTDRLLLRPLTVADAPALAAYQSREDVVRYVPYPPRDAAILAERLRNPDITRSELDEPGQVMWVGVVRAEDDVLVGDAVLMWHSQEHGAGEIGYVFDPAHHGNGYASEAARALLRLGFGDLGLHRIVARLDVRNTASAAVARRLGMRQEAHLVQNEWFKGEWTDELVFAILADEWRAGAG
jgi:RimJ/RimL family protein N-acetyltransferase